MKLRIALTALLLLAVTIIVVVRSTWFVNSVRDRIVAEIEHATGATAKLDKFSFSWASFTATLDGLTLRGAEPQSGPPLFHADRIQIHFQRGRVLTGFLRASDVKAERPAVYLLQRSDGSTNLPALHPDHRVNIADLVRIRIGSIQVHHGSFQFNERRIPLDFAANDVQFVARYNRNTREYAIESSLTRIACNIGGAHQPLTSVALTGKLNAQQLAVERLDVQLGQSSLRANGFIRNFSWPEVDLKTTAQVNAADLAAAVDISWLASGHFDVDGLFHYDWSAGPAFNGAVTGKNVEYNRAGVKVSGGSFTCNAFVTPDLIDASQVRAYALGGSAVGELRIANLARMTFKGEARDIDARSVLHLVIAKPLPFTAGVSGPVQLDVHLGQSLTHALISARVQLAGRDQGATGQVSFEYRQEGNAIAFGPSQVRFPQTQIRFNGRLNDRLEIDASTSSLPEIQPTLAWLDLNLPPSFRLGNKDSDASFHGEIDGSVDAPLIQGGVHARNFLFSGRRWNSCGLDLKASASRIQLFTLSLLNPSDSIRGSASVGLRDWEIETGSPLSLKGVLRTADFTSLMGSLYGRTYPLHGGAGTVSANVSGTLHNLAGSATLSLKDAAAFDQTFTLIQAAVGFSGTRAVIKAAQIRSGAALATIQADYTHAPSSWMDGRLHVRADTNRFGLQTVAALESRLDGLTAQAEVHASGDFQITGARVNPNAVNGTLSLRDITVATLRRGDLTLNAGTEDDLLTLGLAGSLEGSPVLGNLRAHLTGKDEASGELHFGKVSLATVMALSHAQQTLPDWSGSFSGRWHFHGPLLDPSRIESTLLIDTAQLRSSTVLAPGVSGGEFAVTNRGPIVIETAGPKLSIKSFEVATRDASLSVSGAADLASSALNLQAHGGIDLRVVQLFYPDLQTSGSAAVSLDIDGSLARPLLRGQLKVSDGTLVLPDLTDSLTRINGTVHFDRTRAVIENLEGQTGGGAARLTGVVSFPVGQAASYNLDAEANHVRFRYLHASISGDARLRMTGTTQNGLISGDVTISRVVLEPGADLATLFADVSIPNATPANEQEFLTGLGWDIHIQSAPDLQIVTSLSQDVQATIDLRLRGTRAHPALLGQISANQGEVNIFGTRYTISRGNVSFLNPVRIDPVLDLDLQTETRGITVDVIVSGTMSRLSMNYRSDPPLQAKEILALLTVGQTPNFAPEASNSRIQTDTSALQAGATTVLGQAISPASSRLTKLFGITNVKIDPFVQNTYNNRQARLTLEEQVSRNITVTYVTNLAQTSEQIFRFEWSFNPQYSLVAVRDDNGEFGIDIQYKKRFK